ncbi:MAG: hydantoinase/oxoprolinase family protein [bacterium]|nr:hydantoinase/oxoprolinase family protein [bacterium]
MSAKDRTRPRDPAGSRVVGVDTGGTFTDLVAIDSTGTPLHGKVPSTPDDPARAVLACVEALGENPGAGLEHVIHGTTVALNAVLTGRTARTALVTNEGFRDLIEIGRQAREDIYALHPQKPAPLVDRARRFEIDQRSWPDDQGELIEVARPTQKALRELARHVAAARPDSIAICLLHAYADPAIERRVADALSGLGVPITCSAEILPAYREAERFSTAVVNASVAPIMGAYLERLGAELDASRLSIMQSAGGTLSAARAALEPARVLFSGPAGGVVGAARAGAEAGCADIVTLDMGGTSTDVAFHSRGAGLSGAVTSARIGGHPVAIPTLDIHTIGCGGGSIVHVDAGGVLHVGPASAGADPGPVCYGRGDEPTVTDAHVLLGHVAAAGFLDGELGLDVDAVARSFERIGKRLGVQPTRAAEGVLEVARAAMRRAVGVMTMQRGQDPRRLPLVAFGGAGGLAAAPLAASLDMPGALVPRLPGVLSAYGMASADALRDHVRPVLAPLDDWSGSRRKRSLTELARAGSAELREAGFRAGEIEHEFSLDLRYAGQSFEISVPEGRDPAAEFARRHEALYGWRLDGRTIELVQLRGRSVARGARSSDTARTPRRRPAPARAVVGTRSAWFGRRAKVPRVDREALAPGHVVEGPAIVEEFSGTTLVPPKWRCEVRAGGHLWLQP